MTKASRWAIAVFILAMAAIVALLPRNDPETDDTAPVDLSTLGSRPTAGPIEDDATLAPLRKRAAMRPCPSPTRRSPTPAGPLVSVTAPCLGERGTVDLGAALSGKPTLLNLWASWCGPCREEMPVLADYSEQPGAIPVLGVNVKDRSSAALELVGELGVRYPSVYDPTEKVQRALRVPPVLPVNYLVLPDGSVQRITDPLIFRSPEQVRATVKRYLGSQ